MQSTGQTSTQEASFVPMQGSVITYAIVVARGRFRAGAGYCSRTVHTRQGYETGRTPRFVTVTSPRTRAWQARRRRRERTTASGRSAVSVFSSDLPMGSRLASPASTTQVQVVQIPWPPQVVGQNKPASCAASIIV